LLKETDGVFDIARLYMYVDSKCTEYAIPNQRKFTVKILYTNMILNIRQCWLLRIHFYLEKT